MSDHQAEFDQHGERAMTPTERAEYRVSDDQCATWITERLIGDSACLLPLPCDEHAHLHVAARQSNDHPVTEYGTTRCPNEGWVAAEIDDDGECSACGAVVLPPASEGGER